MKILNRVDDYAQKVYRVFDLVDTLRRQGYEIEISKSDLTADNIDKTIKELESSLQPQPEEEEG